MRDENTGHGSMAVRTPRFREGAEGRSSARAGAAVCALLMALAACSGGGRQKSVSFDPNVDPFSPQPDGGTSSRTFECTSKNADGTCNVNVCTQGPGGATYDCASYAAACVDAGEHWSGTKEGGKCTRVL